MAIESERVPDGEKINVCKCKNLCKFTTTEHLKSDPFLFAALFLPSKSIYHCEKMSYATFSTNVHFFCYVSKERTRVQKEGKELVGVQVVGQYLQSDGEQRIIFSSVLNGSYV